MKVVEKNENSKTITLPESIELDMGDRTVILEKGDRIKLVENLPIDGYSKSVSDRVFKDKDTFTYDDWKMVQYVAGEVLNAVNSAVRGGEREEIKDYIREYLETTANGMRIGEVISALSKDIHRYITTGWFL